MFTWVWGRCRVCSTDYKYWTGLIRGHFGAVFTWFTRLSAYSLANFPVGTWSAIRVSRRWGDKAPRSGGPVRSSRTVDFSPIWLASALAPRFLYADRRQPSSPIPHLSFCPKCDLALDDCRRSCLLWTAPWFPGFSCALFAFHIRVVFAENFRIVLSGRLLFGDCKLSKLIKACRQFRAVNKIVTSGQITFSFYIELSLTILLLINNYYSSSLQYNV